MNNVEIAQMLNQYADLLTMPGESPFRARAYLNAARTVGNLSDPLGRLVHEDQDLRTVR